MLDFVVLAVLDSLLLNLWKLPDPCERVGGSNSSLTIFLLLLNGFFVLFNGAGALINAVSSGTRR